MSFTEKLRIVLDMEAKSFNSALKKTRDEIKGAEGATAKFKAGVGGLKDGASAFLSTTAGLVTAGTAVGAMFLKSAMSAEQLGLEVGKLVDSTGLSADAASRWVEVANDLGIGADNVAGLIEKMTKNLGNSPAKFEAMGISVKHAADGTVDMNATLLGALDVLSKIQDPTKRAAEGAALFGKSWSTGSELIAMGADKVREKLAAVDKQHIQTPEQIAAARKMRDNLAELGDAAEGLSLSLGNALIPVLAQAAAMFKPIADGVAWVLAQNDRLESATKSKHSSGLSLFNSWKDIASLAWDKTIGRFSDDGNAAAKSADNWSASMKTLATVAGSSVGNMGEVSAAYENATQTADMAAGAADRLATTQAWQAKQTDIARVATDRENRAMQALFATISDDSSFQQMSLDLEALPAKLKQIEVDGKKSGDSQVTIMREQAIEIDRVKQTVGEYAKSLDLPASVVTNVVAQVTGDTNVLAVEAALDRLKGMAGSTGFNLSVDDAIKIGVMPAHVTVELHLGQQAIQAIGVEISKTARGVR